MLMTLIRKLGKQGLGIKTVQEPPSKKFLKVTPDKKRSF